MRRSDARRFKARPVQGSYVTPVRPPRSRGGRRQSIHRVFAANVQARRKLKDFTIETLAERALLEVELVIAIEQGKLDATLEIIESLARALGVDPADLTEDPEKTPKSRA